MDATRQGKICPCRVFHRCGRRGNENSRDEGETEMLISFSLLSLIFVVVGRAMAVVVELVVVMIFDCLTSEGDSNGDEVMDNDKDT